MIDFMKILENPNISITTIAILAILYLSIKLVGMVINKYSSTTTNNNLNNNNQKYHQITPCSTEHEIIKGKLELIANNLEQIHDTLQELDNKQNNINNNMNDIHMDMIKMINGITNSLQELVRIIRTKDIL